MRYAFIGKIEEVSPKTLRTVALWDRDKIVENLTFFLKDTPCEKVIAREIGFYPQEAQKYFPNDQYLVDWDIHSYLGVPLLNSKNQPFGVLSVMDEKPIEDYNHYHSILSIFASRCAGEMERMDAEARLKLKAFELKKNNQVLKDFISIASHDLQSPLGKIIQFGSRLAEKADNLKPESKEYLVRMQKTARRMQNLVDDLLLFSQSSVQAELFRKTSLSMVFQEVIADLDLMLHKSDAEILVGPLPTIKGNPIQLKQLFKNLLSNAIKFGS